MRIELGCVTGRFQPVHRQHMELFGIALTHCRHLVVAVTNPDPGARHQEPSSTHRHTAEANPFTYYERTRLLSAAFAAAGLTSRVTIVPFDLTAPEFWPQYVPHSAHHFVRAYSDWEREKAGWFEHAGYTVTLIDADPATKLCATDIRADMRAGRDLWHRQIPAATVPVLQHLLAQARIEDR